MKYFVKGSSFFARFFIRSFYVLIVLMSIALFLYASYVVKFFYENKSITLLAWPQEIDASQFAAFEKETGIKVYVRYFENNEELMMKLMAMAPGEIDLVMPTDYAVETFIKKGLLKKIDKNKLLFWDKLNSSLMGHYFDPENQYTIPYYWGVYGIGFDKDFWKDGIPLASWQMVFDRRFKNALIAMPNDAHYLVLIAAQYLFGTIDNLTMQQIQQITDFLINQKSWVELYTESHGEYLLASKASSLVVLLSADIAKIMKRFPNIDFMVPQEGSFVLIDSFALSAHTLKDDLVYQFLNYIYRPDVLKKYVDTFMFFPATTDVEPAFQHESLKIPSGSRVKKIDFYRNVISPDTLSNMWVALKS